MSLCACMFVCVLHVCVCVCVYVYMSVHAFMFVYVFARAFCFFIIHKTRTAQIISFISLKMYLLSFTRDVGEMLTL